MIKIKKITGEPAWITTLKITLKVLTILILLIIVPLIIVNISFIFQGNNRVPNFMGYSMLNVISGSMQGTIDVGDMVIIKQTKEINEQDIVTFIDEASVITHRVVKIEEENGVKEYTTKGDANNTEDKNKITIDQIQGKVIFHLRGFGKICTYLQKPQGLLILVGIPIVLMSITKYFDIKFANKKAMRKQQRIEYMTKNEE